MTNIRLLERYMKRLLLFIVVFPASYFVGMGVNQIRQWLGWATLNQSQSIVCGAILILVLYAIPSGVVYIIAARKVQKYYPITNEIIRDHRRFFLEQIEQEIAFLQEAVNTCREMDFRDDYNLFFQNLQWMKEIRSRILSNDELQREQLKMLNRVFHRGYLIKKLH